MKSIYEITKTYSPGKTEADMWATTKMISDAVEHSMPDDAKEKLYADLYGYLSGGHYDEHFAHEAIEKMYYTDKEGKKHNGPYFTDSVIAEHYEKAKDKIKGYNVWDFAVVLNMIASDNHNLFMEWWPESTSDDRLAKYVDAAVNWLHDEDWSGHNKIWKYLH